MMTDYINRTAAIVQACKQIKDDYLAFDVKEAIKNIPSAVVRCKDCKHYIPDAPCVGGTYHGCKVLEGRDGCEMQVDESFFCAYGERRDPDA